MGSSFIKPAAMGSLVSRGALASLLLCAPSAVTSALAQAGAAPAPSTASPAATPSPVLITLGEAIQRAETSEPAYRSAVTDRGVAGLDRSITRSALLPGVIYHNQYLYTQPGQLPTLRTQITPGATGSSPVFIANNAVHEYVSQGSATETLGLVQIRDYQRASADAAAATARQEIARRGLVVTVVTDYYDLLSAKQKLLSTEQALDEAQKFTQQTEKLEAGREVAHADVVKASLSQQQRERDQLEAKLAVERAQLNLAVLLFPNPLTPYQLADDLNQPAPLPARADVDAAAKANNPDVRAALESLRSARYSQGAAQAAYLPDLALNYSYGIDAEHFAIKTDGARNLGYSASVGLDIPVWDWQATRNRVKQSRLRTDLAAVELTNAQRQLVASLAALYSEAATSDAELSSLSLSMNTAAESLRLVKLRYSAGEATVLEVVDAQSQSILAKLAQADGAARYRVALANLQTLTGILR